MDSQPVFQVSFDFLGSKPVVVEPSTAQLSSDAGLLPLRQLDEQIGMTRQFAEALTDPRQADRVSHPLLEMVRMRVYGILAGYPDQNDHDVLRSDPIFKLICDRSIHDEELASQPTLSRFENAVEVGCFFLLRDLWIDQFIASFQESPRHLTLDIDTFDDATHGEQQLTFFHGYYDQYQYQPRVITCAENDRVLAVCLLYGSAHAALGADDDVKYVVQRLREAWPGVHIHFRGDSGFGVPQMFDACEEIDQLYYSFGIGMNTRLKKFSENTLETAVKQFEATGKPQRLFCAFWYKADSWPALRWVIVKCEANEQGTNRRAMVTNRPGAFVLTGATYDGYADRGESENRNKELKTGLAADRLSDHRYFANLFRLCLHVTAYHLLLSARKLVADPPPPPAGETLPAETLPGARRRAWHNRRRQQDPLGEGHPCTWCSRLIKVGATVRESTRRVIVQLSSSWPYLDVYQRVAEQLSAGGSVELDTG